MPLTPADVHNVAFKKPPIGKRGYDEDEVDAFLDLVEAELARLIEENNDLKAQVDEMQSKPGQPGGMSAPQPLPPPMPVAPPPPLQAPSDVVPDHGQAVKMLALAQETAEKYVADAKTEADRLVAEARTRSEHLVSESRAKADALLSDARTRSEAMERDARAKAQGLVADAERKHTEVVSGLEQKKTMLEKRIEGLRTFEREYRTRLKSYLETQMRELDSRASAEPVQASPAAATANAGQVYASPYGRAGQDSTR
ncbi:MAG TPA: DivIVA domain-containing protein [Mycobacteriales bacterium]|nr:DivIVA domain-containing protein [Mycobacteriales bacterium]